MSTKSDKLARQERHDQWIAFVLAWFRTDDEIDDFLRHCSVRRRKRILKLVEQKRNARI